jgi:hypothetical protein
MATSFSGFDFSGFFPSGEIVKDIVSHERVQNVNELSYRLIRAAESITYFEYGQVICCAINGAHIEIN